MTDCRVYRVDSLVQAYAKEPSKSFKALERRYKRLIGGKKFQAAFPSFGEHPLVEGRGGGSYAYVGGGHSNGRAISLGANISEAVLLHEIAHHVAYRHAAYRYTCNHGPEFCAALLDVVRVAQGAEAEKALRHLYSELGLKVYRNGRVGRVRAPGDAPAKAQPIIEQIVGRKKAAADERARARALVQSRSTEPTSATSRTYEADCVCGAKGLVNWNGGSRTTVRWVASCQACGLFEEVREPRVPVTRGRVAAR